MKCIISQIFSIILLLWIVNVHSKSVTLNSLNNILPENKIYIQNRKRSLNGSPECRPLNFTNNSLKLHYHPVSLFKLDAYTTFASCYYEISKGLILCNEVTARYVYLFYLPVDSINNPNYGQNKDNPIIQCNVEEAGLKNWTFYYQYQNGTQTSEYIYTNTYDKAEYKNYYFELTFENDCVYRLQVDNVQFKKVASSSICDSKFSKTIEEII